MASSPSTLNKIHYAYIVAALFFVVTPYAPNGLLLLADNIIIRTALILSCIGALYVDMLLGIFVFMCVGRIFLERNNRKLAEAKAIIQNNSLREDIVLPDNVGGEVVPVKGAVVDRTVHPDADSVEDYVSYLTHDDNGDTFHAIPDSSIDGKRVIQTTVEGSEAAKKVFGDIHPEKDISDNSAPA